MPSFEPSLVFQYCSVLSSVNDANLYPQVDKEHLTELKMPMARFFKDFF